MAKITWFGHSAFKIESKGARVLIDPFFAPGTGFNWRDAGEADLVLVTHDHGDHVGDAIAICKQCGAMLGAIVGTAEALVRRGLPAELILNGIGFNIGGSLTHKGITAVMTQAFHSSDTGMPAGYIVKMPDGARIYHAGDTGIFASMELLGKLYPLDAALLPIGGVFTMDSLQAAHAARLLGARRAVPMHFGTFPVLEPDANRFASLLPDIAPSCQCCAMQKGETMEIHAGLLA